MFSAGCPGRPRGQVCADGRPSQQSPIPVCRIARNRLLLLASMLMMLAGPEKMFVQTPALCFAKIAGQPTEQPAEEQLCRSMRHFMETIRIDGPGEASREADSSTRRQ